MDELHEERLEATMPEYRKQNDYPFRFPERLTWQVGVVRAATWSRRLRHALVVAAPQTTRYVELQGRGGAVRRARAAAEALEKLVGLLPFYELPGRIEAQGAQLYRALARPELEGIEMVGLDEILAVHRGRLVFERHCLHREPLEVERLGA